LGSARNDAVRPRETIEQLAKHDSLRQCPSDPVQGRQDYRRTIRLIVSPSRSGDSYVIQGAWYKGGIQFKKLLKGESKTLMYAEVAGLPITYEGRPANSPLGPYSSRVPSDQAEGNGGFHGFYHHDLGEIATIYSGMQINRTNRRGVFAFHDGANLLMCDGSVRLASADTDPDCMVAMFRRD
jgi:prepilin-type processing-associated H-X9-DG protein